MGRADVVARLESLRATNELAALAFYAYRDLNRTEAASVRQGGLERCPVSVAACAGLTDEAVVAAVRALDDDFDLRRDAPSGSARRGVELRSWRRCREGAAAGQCLALRHPGFTLELAVTPDKATLTVGDPHGGAHP